MTALQIGFDFMNGRLTNILQSVLQGHRDISEYKFVTRLNTFLQENHVLHTEIIRIKFALSTNPMTATRA